MKKILISLAVLACVAPTMADVVITAVGNGADLEIYLQTTGTEVVRGLALELAADGDLATAAVTTHPDFNTYIDFAFSNSGYQIGDGHPLAVIGAAGAATIGDDDVSLSVGVLDQDGLQGGFSAATATKIATITYTGAGNVCVTADMLRGGVVGDDVVVVDIQATCVAIGPGDCWTGDAASRAQWESVGMPDAWCIQNNARQCHGDADGLPIGKSNWWVSTPDLNVLLAAWNKPYAEIAGQTLNGIPLINADFDHLPIGKSNWRVSTPDLNILLANWNQANAPAPTCQDATGVQP